jgi:uncharacterized membrane protein
MEEHNMKPQMTETSHDLSLDLAKLLGGAAAGALLMYMLDPDRGGARRAQSAAAVRNAGSRSSRALGNAWHSAGARLGVAAEDARQAAGDVADELVESARPDGAARSSLSRMGHAASEALDDTISKAKSAVSRASDAARKSISRAGSALHHAGNAAEERYDDAGRSASRGLGEFGSRVKSALQPAGDWQSAVRNPGVLGGGLLGLYGLTRRSPLGLVLGLAGAALLVRGVTGQPLRSLLSGRSLGGLKSSLSNGLSQTIDFEKSIYIDASPEEVYDLWTDYENFPRFMSHVVEVRDLGRRRSHWVVKGPGGTEFEWNSVLTEQTRPQRLAWRSEPGAEIPQSGSIHLEPQRGGTQVTVRMSYTPPAGVLGHGLATLLGADPKAQMDDDLARMKAFIERGAVPRDAARSRSSSRFLH